MTLRKLTLEEYAALRPGIERYSGTEPEYEIVSVDGVMVPLRKVRHSIASPEGLLDLFPSLRKEKR